VEASRIGVTPQPVTWPTGAPLHHPASDRIIPSKDRLVGRRREARTIVAKLVALAFGFVGRQDDREGPTAKSAHAALSH